MRGEVSYDSAEHRRIANGSTEDEVEYSDSLPTPAIEAKPKEEAIGESIVDLPRVSTEDELEQQYSEDNDDTMSISSSYAASVASVFSLDSLASSASELSKTSGYSAIQIATATKELITIFHEDEVLLPLYKKAFDNPAIGAAKLQRNLRRLFKAYAKHLDEEATDRLEYHAARLVSMKARWLAESIVERFQPKAWIYRADDDAESSDEEVHAHPMNEEEFEDLVVFREFLVGNEAFRTLRAQVNSFVLPKPPEPAKLEQRHNSEEDNLEDVTKSPHVKPSTRQYPAVRTWFDWRSDVADVADAYFRNPQWLPVATIPLYLILDAVFLTTDGFLTATGQLEPPLLPGKVRLRWPCVCSLSSSYFK